MVNTNYNTTQDVIDYSQRLKKGKRKLQFYKNFSHDFDERICHRQNCTFQFEEDPFAKNAQGTYKP